MADESYHIIAGPEFKATADALRDVDKTFPTMLRKAMKDAAQPVLVDVRNAARALPAYGLKHTGLRARLAAGVAVQASVGASARMRFVTKMPPGQEALPRGEDSGMAGWRHPVFGHDKWVTQRGGSWFRQTIADDRPDLMNRLQDVLDAAAQQIDDAGSL